MPTNLNRAGLITESNDLFPNNTTQEISPADLRSWLADGTTSFVTQKDKSSLENAVYESRSSAISAGATVDLSTADGNFVHITGASTITSFGTLQPGARFVIVFDGICLLTYNATSLIIPGSANKTTAAGDACLIISEGSGNWRIVGYFAISGSGGGGGITALTGDVTASGSGSVAATIANGAVDIPMLSATGTPSGTTFLRGDNTWATPAGGGSGTVTSVGLTMPSAFNVSTPNPITTAGTLAVTGAGLDSQYIRGDGTLANFPTSTGGGSSISYYLNGSITQLTIGGVTYYQMSKTPVFGAGTNFTRTSGAGNGYIASFITDAGDPNILSVPGGNFNLEFYFNASSGGGSPQFYGEIYKYDGATLTLIASGSANPEGITNGTTVDQYFTSISVPTTALALTDRLAVRVYVIPSGRNITLHTEDNNLCQVITTISTGLTALNGLTAQVQTFATGTSGTDFNINSVTNTHTFNIPDASASNRGLITTGEQEFAGIKTFGNSANAGEIRLLEPSGDGINWVSIKAQAMAADYSITLPPAAPSGAQYLQSTGTGGVLQWVSGTTTGVSSIGTINSATKNPNGAVISGANLIMQTADATSVGLVSIGTQTFAGSKTFNSAATFSGSATSAATVTINPGASASLTNPQLLISSTGGTTPQFIGFGASNMQGDRNVPTFTNRSIGTKLVLYANVGASSVDHAIGVGSGITWISAPTATGHNISIYGGTSQLAYFQNNGLYTPMPGSSTQGQITIGTNTGSSYAYLDFGGGASVRGVPAATRSVGTRINMFAGSSGTDDHSIGVAANETWIKTNNAIGAIIGFYGGITKIAEIKTDGTGFPIMNLNGATSQYQVNGIKVLAARITGYGTPTGGNRTLSFAATTQAEQVLAQLVADLKTHGLIS